jgi:hypothetical protein
VILGKKDYDERMYDLINNGPYKLLSRNPLSKMKTNTTEVIKSVSENFGFKYKWSIIMSNPSVPKVYGLPKIHKIGNKMRPIVSNVSAPSYKLSKWLLSELNKFPKIEGMYVKNSFQLVKKLEKVELEPDEVLVSFDVVSLFPSIPVDIAMTEMENYLTKNKVPQIKKNIFMRAANVCVKDSFFQFRGKNYKVTKGVNMGNPMSPFIAELFMSKFEMDLKKDNVIPRVWVRYVDDIFAVVKRSKVEETLNMLNSRHPSIKFTVELEENGCLPFLDLWLKRNGRKIYFEIFHKPTSSKRYITSDSHAPHQHKLAAFHSMVHRLCRIPLRVDAYMTEYKYILELANINGYSNKLIDELILKHSKKIKKSNLSTHFMQKRKIEKENEKDHNRVCMTFVPEVTNKLKRVFNKHDISIVYSNKNKLSNILGSSKDKTPTLKKSGIYSIKCDKCIYQYIGQTRRDIHTRYKEHLSHIKYNRPEKSAVASHVLTQKDHSTSINNLSLKMEVNNSNKLDAYESYFIQSTEHTMNNDNGPISSSLFALV